MGGGGKGSTPKAPPPLPDPPEAPTQADESVRQAGDEARRQRMAAHGRTSTILTGGMGDQTTAGTQKKQLLGQ